MPLYNKEEAKKGGFAQVRDALQSFEGLVSSVDEGQWGGKLIDDDGNPLPPKEFFEVESLENIPLEVTEELSMDISERFTFRVNMSEWEGSFWVDEFLVAADKVGVLLPQGIVGKRVVWEKVTKTWDIGGVTRTYINFIIKEVKAQTPTRVPPKVTAKVAKAPATVAVVPEEVTPSEAEFGSEEEKFDPMVASQLLAVGKTEQQFRTAIVLDPRFEGNPLLQLAKAGGVTQALVNDGKLQLVMDGDKAVYQIPE